MALMARPLFVRPLIVLAILSATSCADQGAQSPVTPSIVGTSALGSEAPRTLDGATALDADELTAAATPKTSTVTLVIKGDKNAPLKGASVTLSCPGGFSKKGTTNSAGSVTFTSVPKGKCEALITAKGYPVTKVAVTAPSLKPVSVVLKKDFDGTYTGRSDSGDDAGDDPLSFVVTGSVVAKFTVGDDVLLPGTVSGSGQLAARGGNCAAKVTGQITLTPSGGATAKGTWSHPTSDECGTANSGLWTATRQPR